MVYIRILYGLGMELVWSWYGVGMELVWSWYGVGMENTLFAFEVDIALMEFKRIILII